MRNMSKKTRKKVMRIIRVNCHSSDGILWVPFKSSRMWTVWNALCVEKTKSGYEVFGLFNDTSSFRLMNKFHIKYPEQLTNPRAPIGISIQIVKRWEEGGFI